MMRRSVVDRVTGSNGMFTACQHLLVSFPGLRPRHWRRHSGHGENSRSFPLLLCRRGGGAGNGEVVRYSVGIGHGEVMKSVLNFERCSEPGFEVYGWDTVQADTVAIWLNIVRWVSPCFAFSIFLSEDCKVGLTMTYGNTDASETTALQNAAKIEAGGRATSGGSQTGTTTCDKFALALRA
jgi:hypothetical protein